MRELELLAPAKNLQCGIAAIDCGADAVYIGAEKFGARAAAGNSLGDIESLVAYAHKFSAKVYATLNTIIYNDELDEVRALISAISRIGVDALIVQDMAVTALSAGSNMSLHASTQTDIRDKEKVGMLEELGFSRAVLARELSVEEIRAIHAAHPGIEIEVFVHGALCVSYSGACYASQYCFGRSANRGQCAQFCRMKFDIVDSAGKVIKKGLHPLSLKDLSLVSRLEELADAGVKAFKIEGRLKDIGYVKNVVAAYSKELDKICGKRRADYRRASEGTVEYGFTPALRKTFNRGYTEYFFNGRQPGISSPFTPKATGEYAGRVKEIQERSFTVDGAASFSNGDGLCFINSGNELEGFRVNRADGNRLFPLNMPAGLKKGTVLFRNSDAAFARLLSQRAATRRIAVCLTFSATGTGFCLQAEREGREPVKTGITLAHQPAVKQQSANIETQLRKFGNTVYKVKKLEIEGDAGKYFIPSSMLSAMRKELCALLDRQTLTRFAKRKPSPSPRHANGQPPAFAATSGNVSNRVAEDLHRQWGLTDYTVAPEVDAGNFSLPLMQCRHCIRYSLGCCARHGGQQRAAWQEPLFLKMGDGRMFRLSFDCNKCRMDVWST